MDPHILLQLFNTDGRLWALAVFSYTLVPVIIQSIGSSCKRLQRLIDSGTARGLDLSQSLAWASASRANVCRICCRRWHERKGTQS